MRGTAKALPLLVALALAAPPSVAGQTVADVVEGMYAAIERSASGVDNYTLVQQVMGFETMTYLVKEMVDGRPVFRAQEARAGGRGMQAGFDDLGVGDMSQIADDLVEHGRYDGREQVDGHAVHVIAIDDLSQLDIEAPTAPNDDMEFVARAGRLYVDAELFIPRRMAFEGETTTDTGVHPVTTVVDMLDYREVQGLQVAYRTVITIEGVEAMIDPEMQAQLDEMMEQLEEMDPQQRAMMERMLGPQIEQLREMMGGNGGPMTMEVTVTDVRVNEGPPRR